MTRLRLWAAMAVAFCGIAGAADPPAYSAATILATCNQAPGPFAPNMVVSIFGSGLAWSQAGLTAGDIDSGNLPTLLNGVQVYVNGAAAPLFYVSDSQVNFLMPTNQIAGEVTVWLVRESVYGPQVTLTLQDTVPALFPYPVAAGLALAQHWPDYSLVSPDTPAAPGGIVILYAAGLGRTLLYPSQPNEIPRYAGVIEKMQDFRVYLDGKPLDSAYVLYAGLSPGWPGLYQVNLILPEDAGPNPEIRIGIGDRISLPGLKLAVK